MRRRQLLVAGPALAIARPARPFAAAAGSLARVAAAGVLRAGVQFAGTPLAFRHPDGAPDGLAVAVAELLARGLEVRLELVEAGAAEAVEGLLGGAFDILMTAPPVGARAARRMMFAEPFAASTVLLLARPGLEPADPGRWIRPRLGLLDGPARLELPQGMAATGATIRRFTAVPDLAGCLAAEACDAAVVPDHAAGVLAGLVPGLEIRMEAFQAWLAPALRHGEHDLRRAVDTLLHLAEAEGVLAILHRGFLGRPLPPRPDFH